MLMITYFSDFIYAASNFKKILFKNNILLLMYCTIIIFTTGCGTAKTSGFFSGPTTGTTFETDVASIPVEFDSADTLVNWTFNDPLTRPFGSDFPGEIYHGAVHFNNSVFSEPLLALSTAGLLKDGLVEIQFDIVEAPSHSIIGLILRADGEDNLMLFGVNSRGQYTVQKRLNGMWFPVMGLDAFETSRLLPYNLPGVCISAELHGNYIDFRVNGQLIQVVRTTIPATGQVGVFIDGYVNASLDRLIVIPAE